MRVQHFINIGFRFDFVPNTLGVNYHGGSEFAAIQATRHIHPHPGQPQLLGTRLHVIPQALAAPRRTGTTLMAIWAAIAANENMRLKIWRWVHYLLRFRSYSTHRLPLSCFVQDATA